MSWLSKAWKSVKSATKSPIFKVGIGGLALAFPAVGIPAAAALAMGNKALTLAKSANPAVAQKYRAVIENTERTARAGDPDAKRAYMAMKLAKDARDGKPAAVAEANKIRVHAVRHRNAAVAVMRGFKMHPKTGVLQHVQRRRQ